MPGPRLALLLVARRGRLGREPAGAGFGFWPAQATYLVVHASGTIAYDELPGLDALGVLRRVVETFAAPRASYPQS